MIESGSHEAGVDAAEFGLPPATALRYERPDARLQGFMPSYAVFDSDPVLWKGRTNWKLPGSAQLWIVPAEPMSVRVRNRRYGPLGRAVLYGSTSAAMPLTTNGGVSVMADVGPLGWARWFDVAADSLRDQITPLETLWPVERVEELVDLVGGCGSALEIKGLLDGFFLKHLPPADPREPAIARVARLIVEAPTAESSALAKAAGLSDQQLRRLTLRYFGFGPKVLIRRTRLLRVITDMLMSDEIEFADTPPGYNSVSHFHRDANEFLGATAKRFVAQPTTFLGDTDKSFEARPTAYLSAMLRARTRVIGAPVPLLDRVDVRSHAPDAAQGRVAPLTDLFKPPDRASGGCDG